MRYKVVPEPRSVEFLRDVQAALPLVPGTVEDCCSRIRDRTDLPSRDVAREYLTFVQALDLVSDADDGYYRTQTDPTVEELADRFRARVFGAPEVLDALGAASATVDDCFEAVHETVPQWERDRHADWETEWHDRVERLLEWAVEFGLAERIDDGYQLPDE